MFHFFSQGAIESLSFIFKRPLDSVLGGPDCESAVKEGGNQLRTSTCKFLANPGKEMYSLSCSAVVFPLVKAPQPPEINDISVITHEVATELMGLIRDIRYDLSMQVKCLRIAHVIFLCINLGGINRKK